MKDEATPEQLAMRSKVARAIMETRVRWGWTFGKQKRVMAIDLLMADAAIAVLRDDDHLKGQDHG